MITASMTSGEMRRVRNLDEDDAIGMEHGGEPSAYLIGWIASCINKARLGIGDFVEIVDKEEK